MSFSFVHVFCETNSIEYKYLYYNTLKAKRLYVCTFVPQTQKNTTPEETAQQQYGETNVSRSSIRYTYVHQRLDTITTAYTTHTTLLNSIFRFKIFKTHHSHRDDNNNVSAVKTRPQLIIVALVTALHELPC